MLSIENSVVVIIDIQEKLVNAVGKYSPVDKASRICNAANILNIPLIVTEQYPKGLGKTVAELKLENAYCVEKTAFSAYEDIKNKLESLNKKRVIIFGIEAHICVYQTICDLLANDYEVYFVKDCSASRNEYEFETGVELIKQFGAKITCTEIVLFEWLKSSKHPNFKEIQALIK